MNDADSILCELPPNAELNKPFRNPSGSGRKFSVYTKNEAGDVVKVSFGDPDMEIRRDDPKARKAFRDRFSCDTDPGPKWKAKYWSCRMWDSETVTELTAGMTSTNTITASFSLPSFEGKAPSAIVFFPKGENTVTATRDGKPFTVTVNGTVDLAGVLNAQLQEARNNAAAGLASRPFIDFGHKRDAAAAIPTEIYWDEDLGVMCSLDWTKSGKEAVEGKDFSYFSPEFLPDGKDAAVLRIPGPIGGLVNTPAFQTIGPIAASLTEPTNNQPAMDQLLQLLKKYGMELSDDSDMSAVCSALDAKLGSYKETEGKLETATAALAVFQKAEAETAKAKLSAEADAAVSAAFADGKITDKAPFLAAYLASPETVKAQLAALPAKKDGHPAPVATVTAKLGQVPDHAKTLTLNEFRGLDPSAKMEFSKAGGRISN